MTSLPRPSTTAPTDAPGRTRAHRAAAVAAALTLALVVAGCSEDDPVDDTTSAEAWADDVCSSAADWLGVLATARTILADPRQVSVDDLTSTIQDVDDATAELVDDLADLDAPDTEAGDEATQRLIALSDDLAEQRGIVADAAAQPAGSLEAQVMQAASIGRAVGVMISQVSDAVDDLRTLDGADELRAAFRNSDECQDLTP
ncbi:hypothetical protein [Aeromicrobium sp. IC_218]|uniref:hypothetical protein n=1 Tax=Aeromicrobium sp. IC_218 TaxID=2545468 RepID=UPI00103F4695|nr:hypothetical protein [Aeromicrobium sp. IC_218]TCI97642.1 hypothetical protein E0W78_11370 [Aeromicrobium sp. IC_218]